MILRDPVHGLVTFETEESAIVEHLLNCKEVQRLRRIRQLGLASLAYPGADHTRFSHAVGAATVMVRWISRLRQLDHQLPYWQRLTTERARDAIVAALLHDVGHGPFSHLFESAISAGPSHETWSQKIVEDPHTEVHQVLRTADTGLPSRVASLLRGDYELGYLARAVSGMFDVDRCDYLLRDAHFTGVSYGHFDLDWLLRSLRFGQGETPHLAVDGARGLPAIESFLLARLFMFQQVYFHKACRASEWLLGRILARARQLLLDGTRLPQLPPAAASLLRSGHASLPSYLELDDSALWQCISEWCDVKEPVLADLSSRLVRRRLFKTLDLHTEGSPDSAEALESTARDLVASRGLDPDVYVGLDAATFLPFDDDKASLQVLYPGGVSRPLGEVSFLLGRLQGQRLEQHRLLFPPEIRDELLRAK